MRVGLLRTRPGYRTVIAADAKKLDQARDKILELLAERDPDKTICPSDAARALAGENDFHPYMDPVREAAARLVDDGRLVVTQKGKPVEIATVKGPIRLGLKDSGGG